MLCGEDSACPHVTGLIVAANKAFSVVIPADTYAGVFVALGTIPCAFSCKIAFPNLAFFYEEIVDGGRVFDNAFPFDFLRLPFLPACLSSDLPWQNSGYRCWIFGRRPDKIGGKDHAERTVDDHLKDFVKTSKAVIVHQMVIKFYTLPQPALDSDLHGI